MRDQMNERKKLEDALDDYIKTQGKCGTNSAYTMIAKEAYFDELDKYIDDRISKELSTSLWRYLEDNEIKPKPFE
jgi:hypothetical protein